MLELKNNIFYVGVKDPTLRTFDIFYGNGIRYDV